MPCLVATPVLRGNRLLFASPVHGTTAVVRGRGPSHCRVASNKFAEVFERVLSERQPSPMPTTRSPVRASHASSSDVSSSQPTPVMLIGAVAAVASLLVWTVDGDPVLGMSALGIAALSGVMNKILLKQNRTATAQQQMQQMQQRSEEAALLRELSAAQAQLAAQQGQLEETQRRMVMLKTNAEAMKHAKSHLHASLREREQQIVTLKMRLEKQKRNPGSLDLDHDPVTEQETTKVVRDRYVRQLSLENVELLCKVGRLQSELEARKA